MLSFNGETKAVRKDCQRFCHNRTRLFTCLPTKPL